MWDERFYPRSVRPQLSGKTPPPIPGGWLFDADTEQAYLYVVDEAIFVQGDDVAPLNSYAYATEVTSRSPLT